MSPPRSAFPSPVRRLSSAELSPSVAPPLIVILLGVLVILLCAASWRKIESSQILMHLKAGERIIATHQVPSTDTYSVTGDPTGWIYVEWAWATALAAANLWGGWIGVNRLNVLLGFLTAALLLLRAKRRGARWAENLAVTGFVLAALATGFQPGPGRAAGILFLLALMLGESRRLWPLILLPVIAFAWANVHPAFLLAASVPFFRMILPPADSVNDKRPGPSGYLFIIIMTCLAAMLINPNSLQIARAVYNTVIYSFGQTSSHGFQALWSLFFLLQALAALVLISVVLMRRQMLQNWEILMMVVLALGAFLSPYSVVFLLLYIAAPAATALTAALAQTWHTNRIRYIGGVALCLAVVAMFSGSTAAGRLGPKAYGAGLRPDVFPEAAAGRLAGLPLRNSILNRPDEGGYLAWRIWPSWKICIDERPALYTPEFREQYELLWLGGTGWEELLNLWRVHAVLGSTRHAEEHPESNLFYHLADSDDWTPVFWDRHSILYVQGNINTATTNLQHFRQLKPGISWNAQAARMKTPEQWRELAADLRRVTMDDPLNIPAVKFLEKAEEVVGKK